MKRFDNQFKHNKGDDNGRAAAIQSRSSAPQRRPSVVVKERRESGLGVALLNLKLSTSQVDSLGSRLRPQSRYVRAPG